jgi:hypothetical protein
MIQIPKEIGKCQNDIYGVGTVGSENTSKLRLKTIRATLVPNRRACLFVKPI